MPGDIGNHFVCLRNWRRKRPGDRSPLSVQSCPALSLRLRRESFATILGERLLTVTLIPYTVISMGRWVLEEWLSSLGLCGPRKLKKTKAQASLDVELNDLCNDLKAWDMGHGWHERAA